MAMALDHGYGLWAAEGATPIVKLLLSCPMPTV